uniref:Putative secreted protein n=1 Tax=Ixodes scapularis TaxID=6945 RepID=A0A4D5S015_IXOSC
MVMLTPQVCTLFCKSMVTANVCSVSVEVNKLATFKANDWKQLMPCERRFVLLEITSLQNWQAPSHCELLYHQ